MPTGYTAAVVDGKITELKDFATHCASAFGVFAHQRDEPVGNPLIRPTSHDTYYEEKYTEAASRQQRWTGLSEEQRYAEWSDYVNQTTESNREILERSRVTSQRYDHLIEQVEATEENEATKGFRDFMLNQLKEGKRFDSLDEKYLSEPLEYVKWIEYNTDYLADDVRYYQERLSKNAARAEESNKFIDALVRDFGVEVKD